MLPFARNDATRFISPTKTPEYLAAGKPVVSTSIADVVRPYGDERLARIADTPDDFVDAIRAALSRTSVTTGCREPTRFSPALLGRDVGARSLSACAPPCVPGAQGDARHSVTMSMRRRGSRAGTRHRVVIG